MLGYFFNVNVTILKKWIWNECPPISEEKGIIVVIIAWHTMGKKKYLYVNSKTKIQIVSNSPNYFEVYYMKVHAWFKIFVSYSFFWFIEVNVESRKTYLWPKCRFKILPMSPSY